MTKANFYKRVQTSLFLMLVLILGHLTVLGSNVKVNAQIFLLPPPPPTPDNKIRNEEKMIPNSKQYSSQFQPPTIDLITKELRQGKNVIRINVISEAQINYCKIKFFKQDATLKTVDCVKDHGSMYKGLVDAKPPYQILEVHARDIYGDSTSSVKSLKVIPALPIQDQIWNLLSGLMASMRSIV
jgi:hypothetical protein